MCDMSYVSPDCGDKHLHIPYFDAESWHENDSYTPGIFRLLWERYLLWGIPRVLELCLWVAANHHGAVSEIIFFICEMMMILGKKGILTLTVWMLIWRKAWWDQDHSFFFFWEDTWQWKVGRRWGSLGTSYQEHRYQWFELKEVNILEIMFLFKIE